MMKSPRSSISRILSASMASWAQVGITIVMQVALVPLYLRSWDAETYGAWLLLQAVWAVITTVDVAHHDYVGYECLRLGAEKRLEITRIVFSAAPIAFVIALWDLLVAWLFGRAAFVASWLGNNVELLGQWQTALLLQSATWIVTRSQAGLMVRGLTPFGYYPQFAWWAVLYAVSTAIAPVAAVVAGGNLLQAALTLYLANLIYYAILFPAMGSMARREGLTAVRPRFIQGMRQGMNALWLVAKSLAEMARQQGSRIILSPLAGVADMAAFATMRTGANFALQGLNTVTSPVMPELMRFLAARDQARTESAFAIVWLVLCAVLAPAIVIVQWLAPALFPLWTHGKIAFDPWLFGMLSLGVLVLALAQPAAAVLRGNNILRAQLGISLVAAVVAVGGMALLVPLMGVRGAAAALLAAELTSLCACVWIAQQWLREQGMHWPWKAFSAAAAALPVTALGMVALELLPAGLTLAGLAVILVLQGLVAILYWRHLPALARTRAASLLARFMPASLRTRVAAVTPAAADGSSPKP